MIEFRTGDMLRSGAEALVHTVNCVGIMGRGIALQFKKVLSDHLEVKSRFSRVADLVEGFESPFGLELLSTVHWVASRDNARSADEIVRGVYAWGERKKQFTPRQIALASTVLTRKGWLAGENSSTSDH